MSKLIAYTPSKNQEPTNTSFQGACISNLIYELGRCSYATGRSPVPGAIATQWKAQWKAALFNETPKLVWFCQDFNGTVWKFAVPKVFLAGGNVNLLLS